MFRGPTIRWRKSWYQRMKSRPSFRPLLQDTVRGMAPAAGTMRTSISERGGLAAKLRERAGPKALRHDCASCTAQWMTRNRNAFKPFHQAQGFHGDMDWMPETAERRGLASLPVAGGEVRHRAGPELRTGHRSTWRASRTRKAVSSPSMRSTATTTTQSKAS
jgi:hypothetical protein